MDIFIFGTFGTLIIFYVAICVLFYVLQDYFFFRPERLPSYFQYLYQFPFEEVNFEMEDGGFVNAIHFKVPNSKGVVYYLKGNSRSIKGWGKFAQDFVGKGYDFFMMDYRGFGKSKGKRTEEILFSDAQYVFKWLNNQYQEENIVIYGRSLGSGIAARIASWNRPKMLILDSPYYSFFKQIWRFGGFVFPLKWVLKYNLRTDWYVKKVTCPIFYIHGTKDRLMPYSDSMDLNQLNPLHSKVYLVEDGGHNDLPDFAAYHEYLYDILNDDVLLNELMHKRELNIC
ncbi:MAG: alpha/beta hydrolase [Saprospiraceae bacterium]